jgi:hypothetical protein
MMVHIAWVAATLLSVIGFAAAPGDPVPFKVLDAGDQGIESRREAVVRTAAEWAALWKELGSSRPRPAVDFAKSTVLGICLGSRPTAGFSVKIDTIERQGTEIVVTYRERGPNPTDMVAQMLTSPYLLVTIEKFDGRVRFVRAP